MNTYKITFRVNRKSPVYNYGLHSTNNGHRIDVPYMSVSKWDAKNKPMLRKSYDYDWLTKGWRNVGTNGLRLIIENNRKGKTTTYKMNVTT